MGFLAEIFMKSWLFAIIFFLTSLIFGYLYFKSNGNLKSWKNDYKELNEIYQAEIDERGNIQTQVRQLKLTQSQLEEQLNETEKELRLSRVMIKDLQELIRIDLRVEDTGTVRITDTVFIEKPEVRHRTFEIDDGNLNLQAWWIDSLVNYDYLYSEKILYWTELKPKIYNDKGNKRFFLWRWIWPKKQLKTYIKGTNEKSVLNAKRIEKLN
jgi:hypothetical protein